MKNDFTQFVTKDSVLILTGKNKLEVIKVEVEVEIGDKVEIIDGPLEGTIGEVSAVNPETSSATVMVEMFGREAPVELELSQMRKIEL